ncbi:mechanosensitive ion channel domain-containing protein [uncultured Mucilaginibacter sp.]|uniref:mechanosensitive ion channel domain-containing protein n=1 Tax=uncultured Mucilaginibacter sp. TaxID=797541 RepID=UPI0025F7B63F|nr:mechanosensitive ion channel domain-containing protein [uncultured Mucilaginibacter sp.]
MAMPAIAQDSAAVKTDSALTIPDTLLFKIQKAQAAITEINATNKRGYGIENIQNGLKEVRADVAPVKKDIDVARKVLDTKSLLSYNLILKDALTRLTGWRNTLSKYNANLQGLSDQVIELGNDSVLMVKAKDTTEKRLYTAQLNEIKVRLQTAGKVTTARLDTVSRLLADVSATYLTVTDLQTAIAERLQQSGKSALGRESPYIWAAPVSSEPGSSISDLIGSAIDGQGKILGYFISSTWDNRILLLLIGIGFYVWVYRNFKKAQKPDLRQVLGQLTFNYIRPYPVLATIIIMLNLTPLFEPDSPSMYIELTQLMLLFAVTVHFWKTLSKSDMNYWLMIVGLYITIIITNAVVHDAIWMRLWLIFLNAASLYIGYYFYKKLLKANVAKRLAKPILLIFLALNIFSILFNVFGRISLAKVFSATAIIGLTQVIGLAAFIQVISDALELQIKVSSCSNGLFARLNIASTRASFRRILSVVAVILWLLVFMINLSIAGGVFALVQQVLSKERTFGSVHFSLNNVLFFAVIIYLANMLQKHVGILFGESAVKFEDKTEHKGSKLALIRLIIVVIGVLLAVTASGIPLDKLTVVLGALSVGIGLGMQNIVNNFVSGIILIFEKPFRIGDYVELADKKGKVQDIGIRSSKMLTPQGSEVIIPNGDLLSGRLVNWTLSNDFLKTEVLFKVPADTDLDALNKVIEEEVSKSANILKNLPPEILINTIAADSVELKVIVWITDIYSEAGFKNEFLRRLLPKLKEMQVKII